MKQPDFWVVRVWSAVSIVSMIVTCEGCGYQQEAAPPNPVPPPASSPCQTPPVVTTGLDGVDAQGEIDVIEPPGFVQYHTTECNEHMRLFRERSGHALQADVELDVGRAGEFKSKQQLTKGIVPAGKRVDSYFVHLDKFGKDKNLLKRKAVVS
jgi:hypothetical protein